jgi:hypothetical protein
MIPLPKREDSPPASLEKAEGKERAGGGETPSLEEYGEQSTPVVLRTIKTFLFPSSFKKVLRHFYSEYSPHTNAATFSFSRLPLSQSSVFSVVNLFL